MKKVLLAFFLMLSVAVLFGVKASAAGTGNLVVHFQAWDGNYEGIGSWAWGDTAAGKVADGTDEFGAYWNYDNIAVGTTVGFIAVYWENGGPNWDKKLTGDVGIPSDAIIENETVHVYVFQGMESKKDGDNFLTYPAYIASPDHYNMLLVYYDPSGSYEENIGVHAWNGWVDVPAEWGSPAQVFTEAGKTVSGSKVMGAMLQSTTADAGLLIYAGDDATKKTGDVNLSAALPETPALGDTGVAYVVSKGDAYTAGDNVFYNEPTSFAEEAFSFKLLNYDPTTQDGTYAVDPKTIIVKTSSLVTNPFENSRDEAAARKTVESWFKVRRLIGTSAYTTPLAIERVDFALNNATLNSFVIILEEELDINEEYEVFFNLNLDEPLFVAKNIDITINLTVPADTPDDATIIAPGGFNGWNFEADNIDDFVATRVDDTTYVLEFTVSVKDPFTKYEYKWTRGSWSTEEGISSNRSFVIPNNIDHITFDDVVEFWVDDADAPAEKYAAPDRPGGENLEASIKLEMDTEGPVITFISPTEIAGKSADARIIEVPWGQPFNQNLFPRFRAIDDRDGDLTPFVFVPKGEFSDLDTREEGDYVIMLSVVDEWGNVTEETFIFRVVKE